MAIDVLLSYKSNFADFISFQDLKDGRTVRKISENFASNVQHLKYSSKRKYIAMFESFMKFLLLDPERRDPQIVHEKIMNALTSWEIKDEIQNATTLMNKNMDKEKIKKRKVAGEKIICQDEIKELEEELNKNLSEVVQDHASGEMANYSLSKAIAIRNNLI